MSSYRQKSCLSNVSSPLKSHPSINSGNLIQLMILHHEIQHVIIKLLSDNSTEGLKRENADWIIMFLYQFRKFMMTLDYSP